MKRSILIHASVLFVIAGITGCSADSDDGASGASNMSSTTQELSATLVEVSTVGAVDSCRWDARLLEAKMAYAELERKINDGLAYKWLKAPGQQICVSGAGGFDLTVRSAARLNGRGLLSTVMVDEVNIAGAAHPEGWISTRNFDPTTGDLLTLEDALDATGIAAMIDVCKEKLRFQPDDLEQACANAVTEGAATYPPGPDGQENAQPAFTIEEIGIRIHPHTEDTRWVTWSYALDGALVPWSALRGHIKNERVKALAGS